MSKSGPASNGKELPKASEQQAHHQMQFSIIPRTKKDLERKKLENEQTICLLKIHTDQWKR